MRTKRNEYQDLLRLIKMSGPQMITDSQCREKLYLIYRAANDLNPAYPSPEAQEAYEAGGNTPPNAGKSYPPKEELVTGLQRAQMALDANDVPESACSDEWIVNLTQAQRTMLLKKDEERT